MANTYGRQVVVPLTNKSGGSVAAGDVVIVDTSNNDAFTTTTSSGSTATIGVAQETIANNAIGRVLLSGYAALINVNASVTRGNYGKTHTVAKQATDAGSSRTAGTFCQFLTGGTTPDAVVYPSDLGSGSGTGTFTTVKDEGSNLSTAVVSMDFVGPGVTATGTTAVTVTIPAPGAELDYVEITSAASITATSGATANTVITGNARSYDGSTAVWIEFYCDTAQPDSSAAGRYIAFWLYDGSTQLGQIAFIRTPAAASFNTPVIGRRKLTPSNASHTYSIRANVNAGTGTVSAGDGTIGNDMPAYIRITRA